MKPSVGELLRSPTPSPPPSFHQEATPGASSAIKTRVALPRSLIPLCDDTAFVLPRPPSKETTSVTLDTAFRVSHQLHLIRSTDPPLATGKPSPTPLSVFSPFPPASPHPLFFEPSSCDPPDSSLLSSPLRCQVQPARSHHGTPNLVGRPRVLRLGTRSAE